MRPRCCAELFQDLIAYAGIGPGKRVLGLGPGTGQATEPVPDIGCDYRAIELGEHLYEKMKSKYGGRSNFSIVNDDFITHDLGDEGYDMICSAATIQWIPGELAFQKTFGLLRPGGTLAMMLTHSDYKTPNGGSYSAIQSVYGEYFRPDAEYGCGGFRYTAAPEYGYAPVESANTVPCAS